MKRVPARWWVCSRQAVWWAVSLRVALSHRAAARRAAPAWLVEAGPAGKAPPCSTTAATSNWAASSLSSASPSSPVSSPKRSPTPRLPPVALAPWIPAAAAAALPAPPPPPTLHLLPLHLLLHPVLPQWAAPPARSSLTLRPRPHIKCPFCTPTLFHNPHRLPRPSFLPPFVLHLPSLNEGKAARLVGQQGKVYFFILMVYIFAWTWSIIDNLFRFDRLTVTFCSLQSERTLFTCAHLFFASILVMYGVTLFCRSANLAQTFCFIVLYSIHSNFFCCFCTTGSYICMKTYMLIHYDMYIYCKYI